MPNSNKLRADLGTAATRRRQDSASHEHPVRHNQSWMPCGSGNPFLQIIMPRRSPKVGCSPKQRHLSAHDLPRATKHHRGDGEAGSGDASSASPVAKSHREPSKNTPPASSSLFFDHRSCACQTARDVRRKHPKETPSNKNPTAPNQRPKRMGRTPALPRTEIHPRTGAGRGGTTPAGASPRHFTAASLPCDGEKAFLEENKYRAKCLCAAGRLKKKKNQQFFPEDKHIVAKAKPHKHLRAVGLQREEIPRAGGNRELCTWTHLALGALVPSVLARFGDSHRHRPRSPGQILSEARSGAARINTAIRLGFSICKKHRTKKPRKASTNAFIFGQEIPPNSSYRRGGRMRSWPDPALRASSPRSDPGSCSKTVPLSGDEAPAAPTHAGSCPATSNTASPGPFHQDGRSRSAILRSIARCIHLMDTEKPTCSPEHIELVASCLDDHNRDTKIQALNTLRAFVTRSLFTDKIRDYYPKILDMVTCSRDMGVHLAALQLLNALPVPPWGAEPRAAQWLRVPGWCDKVTARGGVSRIQGVSGTHPRRPSKSPKSNSCSLYEVLFGENSDLADRLMVMFVHPDLTVQVQACKLVMKLQLHRLDGEVAAALSRHRAGSAALNHILPSVKSAS
ncbi:Uncharacterized protein C6orf81-like protein [Anas platyrhynchos]|uniref:Uncharacterized protein C6orf81-like protein n=1 Tax=Anas platyrhynchos TaxID=8839 RepID=R0KYQ8_ANAPL|nr:Uncharacterized protein C6orf81-like protein [Anas platyrhynchos]